MAAMDTGTRNDPIEGGKQETISCCHQRAPGKRLTKQPDRFGQGISVVSDDSSDSEVSEKVVSGSILVKIPSKPRTQLQMAKSQAQTQTTPSCELDAFETSLQKQADLLRKSHDGFVKRLEKEINQLRKAHKRLVKSHNERLQKQESEMEAIRAASIKRAVEADSGFELDNVIQNKFYILMGAVKSWSKAWCREGYATTFDDVTKVDIIRAMVASPYPFTSEIAMNTAFQQNLSISTVVNALLAKMICEDILDNPFFFLKGFWGETSGASLHNALRDVLDIGFEAFRDKAYLWISQTVSMLHPNDAQHRKPSLKEYRNFEKCKSKHYRTCAHKFLQLPSANAILTNPKPGEDASRYQKLIAIISEFGEFALRLATQRARLCPFAYGAKNLKVFKRRLPIMKPHPTLLLESDDTRCDNNKILLIVEPAIFAYGDEEGKNYDQKKLWHPAVVIVDDANRVQGSMKARTQDETPTERCEQPPNPILQNREDPTLESQMADKRLTHCWLQNTSVIDDVTESEKIFMSEAQTAASQKRTNMENMDDRTEKCEDDTTNEMRATKKPKHKNVEDDVLQIPEPSSIRDGMTNELPGAPEKQP